MRWAASSVVTPAVEAGLRLVADVLEVGLHLARPFDAAERPVAGHDHRRVERDDAVERRDPLGERALPADRRAQAEEHVAGEDDALLGQMHDDVAGGVRRADVEQLDATPSRSRSMRSSISVVGGVSSMPVKS